MSKIRADELVVALGLAESRTQAKALIMAGKVRLGPDHRLDKPGRMLPSDAPLQVDQPPRFVSRGGLKLEAALQHWPINPAGKVALDVGASTGGFTDCLLQAGATHVTCVDVGRAQLHDKLRRDPRVTNYEKVNARLLDEVELPYPLYPLVVMDLSFISLTKVLEPVWRRVENQGDLIALIKPQFEAEKEEVDQGAGIIRDPAIQDRVAATIQAFGQSHLAGATCLGLIDSPITGGDGNREMLIAWKKSD